MFQYEYHEFQEISKHRIFENQILYFRERITHFPYKNPFFFKRNTRLKIEYPENNAPKAETNYLLCTCNLVGFKTIRLICLGDID